MYFPIAKRPRSHRRIPVDAHEGSAADFLRRHAAEAIEAARAGGSARDELLRRLPARVADTRNILLAVEKVIAADTAAGADGLRPGDLDRRAQLELARLLSRVLKDRTYRPGAIKKVDLPKPSGGFRTLSIPTVIDRIVQTAILQVVQPYLDPLFLPTTLGGRPGMSTAHALVVAGHLAAAGNRWVVVAADIRKAFDVVPQDRLLAIVHEKFGDNGVSGLIATIVRAGGTDGVGIGQGSPLSPLLLNLYLDTALDRPWNEVFPDVPLIRWIDDVLMLCPDRHEAGSALRVLTRMLDEAKMPLKSDPPPGISNIMRGESAVWLGYELHERNGRMETSIPGRAWEGLRQGLRDAHQADHPAVRAREVILGWVGYLGPCYEATDVNAAHNRITEIAEEEGFGEVPTHEEVTEQWAKAFNNYQEGRQCFDREVDAHRDDEDEERNDTPDAAPPARPFANCVPTEGDVVSPPSSNPNNPTATEPVPTRSPSPTPHTTRGSRTTPTDPGPRPRTRPRPADPRRPPDDGRRAAPRADDHAPLPHRRPGASRSDPHRGPDPTAGPGPARPPPSGPGSGPRRW
jgi:hypothetical protein